MLSELDEVTPESAEVPFAHADIRFRIEPTTDSTRVTVEPEYALKFGPVGALMDRLLVQRTYKKGMDALLDGLKRRLEDGIHTS